jgi:hypothetical protein
MRKTPLVALTLVGLFCALAVRPASAQDILGLSLRPTDEMPSGTARGSVDLVADNGGYVISVDLSGAAEALKLESFEGAQAFVAWAVDTNGVRHNLGSLDEGLVLKDARADYPVAQVFVTAEPDAAAGVPAGEPLFTAALRNVTIVDATATPADGAPAAAPQPTAAAAAAPAATAAAPAPAKPKELPTTGETVPEVWALVGVALALLAVGWRLRAGRA